MVIKRGAIPHNPLFDGTVVNAVVKSEVEV